MGFIIAFDTLCQGWSCWHDENDKPLVFATELDAYREILDSAITSSEVSETPFSPELLRKIQSLYQTGTLEEIKSFFENNEGNLEVDEFVVTEEEYIQNRMAIIPTSS
jgi:hypothetical protein